jgi:hypothetical protein
VYRDALPGYHIVGNYFGGSSGWINTDAIHCRAMGVTDSMMIQIDHIPVAGTQPSGLPVAVTAFIKCHPAAQLTVTDCQYRLGTSGPFTAVPMTATRADSFSAAIPGASAGDTVEYYLSATDNSGRAEQQPRFAPATWCHRYVAIAVGVEHDQSFAAATRTGLMKAAPNPASQGTVISFQLAGQAQVCLAVYDVTGRRVRNLARGALPAGPHSLRWDGRDEAGRKVGAGVYFVALDAGHVSQRVRLVVVR